MFENAPDPFLERQQKYEEQKRQAMFEQKKYEEEKKQEQRRPAINSTSKSIVESSVYFTKANFLERQHLFEKKKMEKKSKIIDQVVHKDPNVSFHPKINNFSHLLLPAQRFGETFEERIRRLSYNDRKKLENLKEALKEKYYNSFSFAPEINPSSENMVESTGQEELVNYSKRERRIEELKEALEKDRYQKLSFKPKIVAKKTEELAKESKYRIKVNDPEECKNKVEQILQHKTEKILQMQRENQVKEVEECTFNPKINKDKKTPAVKNEVIVVNGLGKHLERTERAKKIKEEKEEREKEAFQIKGKPKSSLGYTIPQPFSFNLGASR